ncbi:MAG: hypothetical protein U1F87_16020 [Kiritimatiellia bacterium]
MTFADPAAAETTATFSAPGAYVLTLTGGDEATGSDTLEVNVLAPPPAAHLDPVPARGYTINSPSERAREALVTTWIPPLHRQVVPARPAGGRHREFHRGRNKNAVGGRSSPISARPGPTPTPSTRWNRSATP